MNEVFEALVPLSEIRELLIEALGDELGTYTYSVGTTPAIAVEDYTQPSTVEFEAISNEQAQVTGLEVVISRAFDIPMRPMLGGGIEQTISTVITLKQWDITKTTELPFFLAWVAIQESGLAIPAQTGVRRPRLDVLDNVEETSFSYIETVGVTF